MAFINYKSCSGSAKQSLRLALLVVCICVSCYQLAASLKKIQHPPISTHYGFHFNRSLKHPAVTICRSPPYKTELFEKYGFTGSKEIEISSTWKSFKYDQYTLREFFENATYSFREMVTLVALDKDMDNLDVTSLFALKYGRCFTVSPKSESTSWGSQNGYFFIFSHTNSSGRTYLEDDDSSPGFHVFIQDEVEKFTEKSQQADIFKEYVYVEAGDGVQVNLKISKLHQLPSSDNGCNPHPNYSKSRCVEDTANNLISQEIGCSTPWIPNDSLPPCSSFEETRKIIEYSTPSIYLDRFLDQAQCEERCNATTYTPFVQSIRQVRLPNCAIKLYFSSNLYTIMEEVVGYDWNAFLADLGGSLGFFLGLSVLGTIGLVEELVDMVVKIKGRNKEVVALKNEDVKSQSTVEISDNEMAVEFYQKKCNFDACNKDKY